MSEIPPQVLVLVAVSESVKLSYCLQKSADKNEYYRHTKNKHVLLGIKSLGERKSLFDESWSTTKSFSGKNLLR